MEAEIPFALTPFLPLAADTGNGRPKRLAPAARVLCSSAMGIFSSTLVNAFLPEEYERYAPVDVNYLTDIEKYNYSTTSG